VAALPSASNWIPQIRWRKLSRGDTLCLRRRGQYFGWTCYFYLQNSFSTIKVEAARSSETSVKLHQSTPDHIPKDSTPQPWELHTSNINVIRVAINRPKLSDRKKTRTVTYYNWKQLRESKLETVVVRVHTTKQPEIFLATFRARKPGSQLLENVLSLI
jgi:hypothetical protein